MRRTETQAVRGNLYTGENWIRWNEKNRFRRSGSRTEIGGWIQRKEQTGYLQVQSATEEINSTGGDKEIRENQALARRARALARIKIEPHRN